MPDVKVPRWARPYKYKTRRPALDQRLNRIPQRNPQEQLSGYWHGKEASDLEERFGRALDQRKLEHAFEFEVRTAVTLPGEERSVDFVVFDGQGFPIEIDADFTHKSAEQKEEDKLRDALIDEVLGKEGYAPIQRVGEEKLITQEEALKTVDELF